MMEARPTPAEDRLLVVAAQGGDDAAYDLLVQRHAPPLLRLARAMVRTPEDAEDAVQDAFVRAFRALPGFRADAAFATWLHRIAINACHDIGRTKGHSDDEYLVQETEERFLDPRYTVDANRVLTAIEQRQDLDRALQQLPPSYRTAVLLHDQEGYSMPEVAALTAVPVPTAKARLRRGRMLLIDILAGSPTV